MNYTYILLMKVGKTQLKSERKKSTKSLWIGDIAIGSAGPSERFQMHHHCHLCFISCVVAAAKGMGRNQPLNIFKMQFLYCRKEKYGESLFAEWYALQSEAGAVRSSSPSFTRGKNGRLPMGCFPPATDLSCARQALGLCR